MKPERNVEDVAVGKSLKVTLEGLSTTETDWSLLEVSGADYTRRGNSVYLKGEALGLKEVTISYNGSIIKEVTMSVIE